MKQEGARVSARARWIAISLAGLTIAVAWMAELSIRWRVERQYREALESRKVLQVEVSKLQVERDQLSATLTAERQRTGELSSALSSKETELQETIERLAQEDYVVQELHGKLTVMQSQIDRLQGELAVTLKGTLNPSAKQDGGAVELQRVVVNQDSPSTAAEQGKVVSVHPEWGFVVVNLGWDAVEIGDVVSIYRNEQLMAKARIERVQEQVSAATLLPEWVRTEVQVDDTVRAL